MQTGPFHHLRRRIRGGRRPGLLLSALAIGLSGLISLAPRCHAAPQPGQLDDAWTDAASLQANTALSLFKAARKGTASGQQREIDLGSAVALLDAQPKTAGNIARAADLFQKVAAANPSDERGLDARYFLARIDQFHRNPADPAHAAAAYRSLIADAPGSPVGQLAASKLAIVTLYALSSPAEVPARFTELEKLAAPLSNPVAAAEFHLALGMAAIDFDLPPQRAFDHLAAADRYGVPGLAARANNLVRLGRLALRLHRPDLAAAYWGTLIRDFPHDMRGYTLAQELKELGGKRP